MCTFNIILGRSIILGRFRFRFYVCFFYGGVVVVCLSLYDNFVFRVIWGREDGGILYVVVWPKNIMILMRLYMFYNVCCCIIRYY